MEGLGGLGGDEKKKPEAQILHTLTVEKKRRKKWWVWGELVKRRRKKEVGRWVGG